MTDPRDAVRALFARTRLAGHAEAIAGLARDTVFLHGAEEVPPEALAPGTSRAFGEPDLPPGTAWPTFERPFEELARVLRPEDLEAHLDQGGLVRARDATGRDVLRARLEFIAQLRLEDVAEHDVSGLLPHSGLLSFFLAPELLLDLDPSPVPGRYLVPCRVLHSEGDPSTLRPVAPPADAPPHTRRPPMPLTFSHGLTLPSPDHAAIQALGLPDSEYGPASWKHDGDLPMDRMLGYHGGTSEVGLPLPGEVLLFQATHLDWVHAHVMFVCLPEAALAARDFSAAYCVPSLE
jgi:hypothetical protein